MPSSAFSHSHSHSAFGSSSFPNIASPAVLAACSITAAASSAAFFAASLAALSFSISSSRSSCVILSISKRMPRILFEIFSGLKFSAFSPIFLVMSSLRTFPSSTVSSPFFTRSSTSFLAFSPVTATAPTPARNTVLSPSDNFILQYLLYTSLFTVSGSPDPTAYAHKYSRVRMCLRFTIRTFPFKKPAAGMRFSVIFYGYYEYNPIFKKRKFFD